MTWEEYEAMLNDLANGEIEKDTLTTHLVKLKKEGAELFDEHEARQSRISDLEKERTELIDENRKLFLQIPTSRTKSPEELKQEEQEEFEESVSIADIRRGRV